MGERVTEMTSSQTRILLLVVFVCTANAIDHHITTWKSKGNMHSHESPEYLFKQGDTNKDDFLDAKELAEFYKHDEDQFHGAEIAKHFGGEDKATAALDLNQDGKIDASEFLDYASPAHAKAVAWDDFDLVQEVDGSDGDHK